MGLKSQIDAILSWSEKSVRRVGVVGELVNGATVPLFAIVGGPVLVKMVGILTAAFVVTATTVQLLHSVTAQAMGLACTTLSGQAIGIHLNPTGAVGAAIAISAGTSVGVYQVTYWSLSIGNINLLIGGATSAVAAIDWYVTYIPLMSGARVTPL